MFKRPRLRLRIFLLFAALAGGSIAALVAGLYYGFHKQDHAGSPDAFVISGIVAGLIIAGLITWVWLTFDDNVAKPIERLAAALRTRTHASVSTELDLAAVRYLDDLGPAARDLVRTLDGARQTHAEPASTTASNLVYEKALLETLLTDIAAGVLMCSATDQLVFYNVKAASLIGGLDADATPGLNRSLFEYLHPEPIRAAYARLQSTGNPDAASDIMCATQSTGAILLARIRLLPDHRQEATPGGYMLTLHNDATLTLQGWEHPVVSPRDQVIWTIHATDLADALKAQLNAKGLALRCRTANLIVRCNGFQLIALLNAASRQLAGAAPDLFLDISPAGAGALISLQWNGVALSPDQMHQFCSLDLGSYPPGTTVQAVLDNHAATLKSFSLAPGRAGLHMTLPEARLALGRALAIPKTLVYDFELLFKSQNTELFETHIEDLTYVVFDTETTGLYADQGDKIVQIAGVRIVNGRRVQTEIFNTLVNPGRTIPLSSTNVHGITDYMVADAPTIDVVARKFHQFVKGAVLVAHNAPFDMAFLRQQEQKIGRRFDNPILDTVLLSAVVFGQSENHSLDALTHRLGITLTEEDRHTAIGDATATADVFLKLVPALKARGLETFGDVLSEVRKQHRVLKDLND